MTREAKIGMLTGLGVIILIGVLLSEYLGGGARPGMSPTGRMSPLPMAAAYRQEVMQPTGVPGLAQSDAVTTGGTGTGGQALANGTPSMPAAPIAYASTDTTGAPRMDAPLNNAPALNQPVAAVPAGNIQTDAPSPALQGSVPTVQLPDNGMQAVYMPGQGVSPNTGASVVLDGTVGASAPAKVAGQEYVIVPGDNLAKIAKKFYKSAKSNDIERIVAANPAMLKTSKSTLIAGKKLTIPAVAGSTMASSAVTAAPSNKTVIRHPGTSGDVTAGSGGSGTIAPAKKDSKVYVVQANDTLEKIARKLGSGNVNETVKKLMALNGIQDAKSLQVGTKLKLPTA